MPSVIRNVIRGCGTLPHVGEHPGWPMLVAMLALGGIAGVRNESMTAPIGLLIGLSITAAVAIPAFLVGAHQRAVTSDAISNNLKRSDKEERHA